MEEILEFYGMLKFLPTALAMKRAKEEGRDPRNVLAKDAGFCDHLACARLLGKAIGIDLGDILVDMEFDEDERGRTVVTVFLPRCMEDVSEDLLLYQWYCHGDEGVREGEYVASLGDNTPVGIYVGRVKFVFKGP